MVKKKQKEKNQFFDINRFPKEGGLFLFPISISNIDTKQKALSCLNQIKRLNEKIVLPKVGLNFIYGDYLYFNSDEKAFKLKNKFMYQVSKHKKAVSSLILKNHKEFQIQEAFNYFSWNDLYLLFPSFPSLFEKTIGFYKKDKLLRKYIKEDSRFFKRKLTKNQLNFFLEEHLVCYLLLTSELDMPNNFLRFNQKWILWCYTGVPPKALVYLCQKDPFKLRENFNNKFYGQYNLQNKKFYDFDNIDLETWNYK